MVKVCQVSVIFFLTWCIGTRQAQCSFAPVPNYDEARGRTLPHRLGHRRLIKCDSTENLEQGGSVRARGSMGKRTARNKLRASSGKNISPPSWRKNNCAVALCSHRYRIFCFPAHCERNLSSSTLHQRPQHHLAPHVHPP